MLSFNKWLVRYMSIPLGVSRKKLLNVWVIFTFDAIWHDLEWLKTLSGNSYFVNSVLLLVQLQSLASWVVLGRFVNALYIKLVVMRLNFVHHIM
ncbi:membrane-bound O-acyltransferase GUP2-like isoform X3 [Cicer arietinum]|uniref:Glycerol uptake protein 2-like isoform X3 n=1 Tax=Cicer arietinum TaxID=3827 RepID=A0A3Q7Y9T9_CICAR|nr:glycerol uptake protein 2-like isoform X3 [Cicer arietinum]